MALAETTETAIPVIAPERDVDGRPLRFEGTGAEFFGIWIVNIFLSIVTVGIWSAWATVRERRYMLGRTMLEGSAFEYHGRPIQILKGRILAFLVIGTLAALQTFFPIAGVIATLLVLPLMPWAINLSLRFNARMTSWRGVRFDFRGSYWGAFRVFVLWNVLTVLTLFILTPWATRARAAYVAGGHSFGQSRFSGRPMLGPLIGAGIGVVVYSVVLGIALAIFGVPQLLVASADPTLFAIVGYGIAGLFVIGPLFYAAVARNEVVRGLTLEPGHGFSSNMSPAKFAWVTLSNLVLIVISIGLLTPWATVRMRRVLTNHVAVLPKGDLDGFVAAQPKDDNAFAAEVLDIQGIDIGL